MAGARLRAVTQMPPQGLGRTRWAAKYPEAKGKPKYHADSYPPGYKIFVGDLPAKATDYECWVRIQCSCNSVGAILAYDKIRQVKVTSGRAHSGSSYVVITVSDYTATEVTQFKEKL